MKDPIEINSYSYISIDDDNNELNFFRVDDERNNYWILMLIIPLILGGILSLILILYMISQFFPPRNIDEIISLSIFVTISIILFFFNLILFYSLFFYKRTQNLMIKINLKNNCITYYKKDAPQSIIINIALLEVRSIYYYKREGRPGFITYFLKIELANLKDEKVFFGNEHAVKKAGLLISEFINKPLIDKGRRYEGNIFFLISCFFFIILLILFIIIP